MMGGNVNFMDTRVPQHPGTSRPSEPPFHEGGRPWAADPLTSGERSFMGREKQSRQRALIFCK